MRRVRGVYLFLAVLAAAILAVPAASAKPVKFDATEFPGYAATFRLQGSNGYSIEIDAYSRTQEDEERIYISAVRKGSSAHYSAPVRMTATTISADLGSLGRVDLHLNPSGRKRTIPVKCGKGETFTYEPGVYEGILEFKGEEGYTTVSETQLPLRPQLTSFCFGGRGSGESSGPDIPGARLRGVSYAHGRTLSFQVNKNRPGARTVYEASLRERHDGISAYREVWGVTSAAAFRFQPDLQTATLSPSSPFSGSASIGRSPNAVSPIWTGNLALDFPGRSDVPLAGPSVHVSLVHARFNCSNDGSAVIGARPRCGFHR
ncbi:MAG TPA: hypothetical protein VGK45_15155 [Thermoanaerobaculia bacterium]|jgi:hypothetical protein